MAQLDLFMQKQEANLSLLHTAIVAGVVSVDIETNTKFSGFGPKKKHGLSYPAEISAVAFSWLWKERFESLCLTAPFTDEGIGAVADLLQTDTLFVAHNAVFDMRGLGKLTGGVWPERVWDTQVMAKIIHPMRQWAKTSLPGAKRRGNYSLLAVAEALSIPIPEYMKDQKKLRGAIHKLPLEQLVEYVTDDTLLTLQIYYAQLELMQKPDPEWRGRPEQLSDLVDWGLRATREYCRMTVEGVTLNTAYVQKELNRLGRIKREKASLLLPAGLEKPSSYREVVNWLYTHKGLPLPEWKPLSKAFTANGHKRLQALADSGAEVKAELSDLSASGKYLAELFDSQPEIKNDPDIRNLYDFLNVKTRISTLTALLEHSAVDGRIHSLVSIKTETLRRASDNPQVQNFQMAVGPEKNIAGDMGGVLIGRPGFTLVEIDYSNAENWWAALISRDNALAAACSESDFHSAMAMRYFASKWAEFKAIAEGPDTEAAKGAKKALKRLRTQGKSLTFGDAYGMGVKKLAVSAKVTQAEAKALKEAKEAAFPDMARVRAMAVEKAESSGYVNLWTGQPVIVNSKQTYIAWNYLCQGAVGQQVMRAIVLVGEAYRSAGLESRVALDMHDALVIEVKHTEWNQAITIAQDIMQSIVPAELNNRTNPPIQWIAKYDPAENPTKWGKMQTHPDFTGVQSVQNEHIEHSKQAPQRRLEAKKPAAPTPEPVADLSRQWDELEARHDRLVAELKGPYKTRLPVEGPNGVIGLGAEISVDLENWAKVPLVWLGVADKCDTYRLIGLTTEALQAIHDERVAQWGKLKAQLEALGDQFTELGNRIAAGA